MISSRRIVVALVATPTLLASTLVVAPAPAARGPAGSPPTSSTATPSLALPAPTGPHPVGARVRHLVDESRTDPWVPSSGARQLMVTVFYPARSAAGRPAPYETAAESTAFLRLQREQGNPLPADLPDDVLSTVRTGAVAGSPPAPGRYPLVVLSPGFSLARSSLTSLATDLASRGYVVAAIDHVHESAGTSLPGGELATCAACDTEDYAAVPPIRARDVSFALDRLLAPGTLTRRVVDPTRIAMVGHSIGGNSSATAMRGDRRIDAGVNFDGTFFDPARDVDRPFLMLGTEDLHRPSGKDRTWLAAWREMTGPREWRTVEDATHFSFLDYPALLDQLGLHAPGTPDGDRLVRITRAYVAAFLDRHLRGRGTGVPAHEARRFPEVHAYAP